MPRVANGAFFSLLYAVRPQDPFDNLLHRYRGLLYTQARHFSRRGTDADDLLQEAAIALWGDRERLLGLPAVEQAAMVWRIGRNAMIDTLRRSRPTEALPDYYEATADDNTMVRELHERIALMDEPDRTLLTMQLEGYSYDEIAAATGLTEKNVSVRLVRAKEKLKKTYYI